MRVRILLGMLGAEWKRLLTEVIRSDGDLEIVGAAATAVDVLLQAADRNPDVVVLAQLPGGAEPGICSHLLLEFPNVAILLLPHEPRRGVLWRMVLHKESWPETTEDVLRAVLKR